MSEQASTQPGGRTIQVGPADLPLHCPMPGQSLWNSHPRVFLPIESKGEAHCPYCGAHYVLKGGPQPGHH